MKRLDIVVDIETLGVEINSTIIQLSAIAFDIHTGEHLHTFNEYVNIDRNKELKVSSCTLRFWLETNPGLLNMIISKQDQSSEEVLTKFNAWLTELGASHDVYLWGNGIAFDNIMIKTAISALGLKYPISFRNDRDIRTLVELAALGSGLSIAQIKNSVNFIGDAHDALNDCKYQIEYMRMCLSFINIIKQEAI